MASGAVPSDAVKAATSCERELTPCARIAGRRSDAPGLLVRLGWTSFYGRARRKLQLADPLELGHAGDVKDDPRSRA